MKIYCTAVIDVLSLSLVCISSIFSLLSRREKRKSTQQCSIFVKRWWSFGTSRYETNVCQTNYWFYCLLNDFLSILNDDQNRELLFRQALPKSTVTHSLLSPSPSCRSTVNLLILNGSPGNRCCKISTCTKHRYLRKMWFYIFYPAEVSFICQTFFSILLLMGVSISDQIMLVCDFNWIYSINWQTSAWEDGN